MASRCYEIRVMGTLPPEALVDFEELTAAPEPAMTVVHGQLADQAALYGLLARLELLGVQVEEVRRLRESAGTRSRRDRSPRDPGAVSGHRSTTRGG